MYIPLFLLPVKDFKKDKKLNPTHVDDSQRSTPDNYEEGTDTTHCLSLPLFFFRFHLPILSYLKERICEHASE